MGPNSPAGARAASRRWEEQLLGLLLSPASPAGAREFRTGLRVEERGPNRARLHFADGSAFEGDFAQGEITGRGTMQWRDGAVYEGDFARGWRHGNGLFVAQGVVYRGEFRRGKKHGYGRLCHPSGAEFEGHFAVGLRHGAGVMRFPGSREVYSGEFVRGEPTGFGKMLWRGGAERYKGFWLVGRINGLGAYTWTDAAGALSNRFVGAWSGGKRTGPGIWMYANGDCYIGTWGENAKHGPGLYIDFHGGAELMLFSNDARLPFSLGAEVEPRLAHRLATPRLAEQLGAEVDLGAWRRFCGLSDGEFKDFADEIRRLMACHVSDVAATWGALSALPASPRRFPTLGKLLHWLHEGGFAACPPYAALCLLLAFRRRNTAHATLHQEHLRLLVAARTASTAYYPDDQCAALEAFFGCRWTPPFSLDYACFEGSLRRLESAHLQHKERSRAQLGDFWNQFKRLQPRKVHVRLGLAGLADALICVALLASDLRLEDISAPLIDLMGLHAQEKKPPAAKARFFLALRVERSLEGPIREALGAPFARGCFRPGEALRRKVPSLGCPLGIAVAPSSTSEQPLMRTAPTLTRTTTLDDFGGARTTAQRTPSQRRTDDLLAGGDFVVVTATLLRALLAAGGVRGTEELAAFLQAVRGAKGAGAAVADSSLVWSSLDRWALKKVLVGYFETLGLAADARLSRFIAALGRPASPPAKSALKRV